MGGWGGDGIPWEVMVGFSVLLFVRFLYWTIKVSLEVIQGNNFLDIKLQSSQNKMVKQCVPGIPR